MGGKREEHHLDRSIERTFPASDPVAPNHPTATEAPASDMRRQPIEITRKEIDAAAPETETCPLCRGTGTGTGTGKAAAGSSDGDDCPQCLGHGRVVVGLDGVDSVAARNPRAS